MPEFPIFANCYAQNCKDMNSRFSLRILTISLAGAMLFPAVLQADEVTKDLVLSVAGKIVKQYFPADLQIQSASITLNTGVASSEPFYVCNVGNTGFVLVSKNDNCPPVLGFSWEGSYAGQSANGSELMKTILGNIRTQCEDYAARDTVNPKITESWDALSSVKSGSLLKTGIISPLLATAWGVDSTYFDLFPKNFKTGGSVPVAMGQVFRFYARPTTGMEKSCYILNGYGELCTDYTKAKLNYSRMSNTSGNSAVDSLIYYMSMACRLQPEGASLEAYRQTLPLHFNYSDQMSTIESWNYNIGDVIRFELSLRHPVPADWLGQSFVIDGYFPDNLYHFNMGLGGQYNGFYLLDYPVVKIDTDHSMLSVYTNYHPKSDLPVPMNVTAVADGDNVRVSWNINLFDSAASSLKRYVVLRDGIIPIAESTQTSILLSPEASSLSSDLRVIADFGALGSSELSVPFRYITDSTLTDIPSLALRQMINTKLGASDLLRQPFVGELDLIRELEITFQDQRGIEKLPQLKNLRVDGTSIRSLRDGDYLQRLDHFRFFKCIDFDFTILGKTRNLMQLYGYDYLPVDLYEFRHNTDLGLLIFTTVGTNPNMLMDLYGADKYFPKLADFYVRHLSEGVGGTYQECFVSYESYLDVYPKIKSNQNLVSHTKPADFAPCYPVPARNANIPSVSRISWKANNKDAPDVFYNVFVGTSRNAMDMVSVFQSDKFYDGMFEPNKDYFWRVEAYHADSTYYSGVFHFSTWQELPMPFAEKFDGFYSACPVIDESPFWKSMDIKLTAKAVANRNVRYEGFYSLELKPKSDAGVVVTTPRDSIYYIEFRFLNQGGEIAAELLQKSSTTSDNIVNSKIEFLGKELGLFTYGGSTSMFNFVPDKWNRANIALHMNSGIASLSINDVLVKEWQWHVQIGGGSNTNPFKGIRFVNNAATSGGSGFIDNVLIDQRNPASAGWVVNPEIGMIYQRQSRQVVFTGIEPSEIREISLFDLQGRKLVFSQNPNNLSFSFGSEIRNGIYLVVVNRKDGRPFSRKIAVVE